MKTIYLLLCLVIFGFTALAKPITIYFNANSNNCINCLFKYKEFISYIQTQNDVEFVLEGVSESKTAAYLQKNGLKLNPNWKIISTSLPKAVASFLAPIQFTDGKYYDLYKLKEEDFQNLLLQTQLNTHIRIQPTNILSDFPDSWDIYANKLYAFSKYGDVFTFELKTQLSDTFTLRIDSLNSILAHYQNQFPDSIQIRFNTELENPYRFSEWFIDTNSIWASVNLMIEYDAVHNGREVTFVEQYPVVLQFSLEGKLKQHFIIEPNKSSPLYAFSSPYTFYIENKKLYSKPYVPTSQYTDIQSFDLAEFELNSAQKTITFTKGIIKTPEFYKTSGLKNNFNSPRVFRIDNSIIRINQVYPNIDIVDRSFSEQTHIEFPNISEFEKKFKKKQFNLIFNSLFKQNETIHIFFWDIKQKKVKRYNYSTQTQKWTEYALLDVSSNKKTSHSRVLCTPNKTYFLYKEKGVEGLYLKSVDNALFLTE